MEEQIRQSNRELIALSRLPAALPGGENPSQSPYDETGFLNKETQELLRRFAATQERQHSLGLSLTGPPNHMSPGSSYGPLSSPRNFNSHFSSNGISPSRSENGHILEHEQLYSFGTNVRRNLQMISPTEINQLSPGAGASTISFGNPGKTPSSYMNSQQQVAQLSNDLAMRNSLLRAAEEANSEMSNAAMNSVLQETFLRSLNGVRVQSGTPRGSIDATQALTTTLQTQYLNQLLLPHILAAQAQAMSNAAHPSPYNANIPPMPALLSSANHVAPSNISPVGANVSSSSSNLKNPSPALALLAQQNPLLLQSLTANSHQHGPTVSRSSTLNVVNISPTNGADYNRDTILLDLTSHKRSVITPTASKNLSEAPTIIVNPKAEVRVQHMDGSLREMRRSSDPVLSGIESVNGDPNLESEKFSRMHQGLLVPAVTVSPNNHEANRHESLQKSEAEVPKNEKDTLVAIIQKNIMGQLHNPRRDSVITNGSNQKINNLVLNDARVNENPDSFPGNSGRQSGSINVLDSLFKSSPANIANAKSQVRKRKHRARETVTASEIFNDESSRSGSSSPSVHPGYQSPALTRNENTLISALASDNGDKVSAILQNGSLNVQRQGSSPQPNGTGGVNGVSKHVNFKKNWAVQYQRQETAPDVNSNQGFVNNENSTNEIKKPKTNSSLSGGGQPQGSNGFVSVSTPQQHVTNGVNMIGAKTGARRGSRETIAVSEIFTREGTPQGGGGGGASPFNAYQRVPLQQSNSPDSSSGYSKTLDVVGAYLQSDTCCVVAPKPNLMCRDCRARGTSTTGSNTQSALKNTARCNSTGKTSCRFSCFRKLKNSKNKYPSVVGFLQAEFDAKDEDLFMWKVLETNFEALNFAAQGVSQYSEFQEYRKVASRPDKAIFRIEQVANFLCSIIHQEQLVHNSYREPVYWKRFMGGCRELCDVCSTSLFNLHWLCPKCGFVVCLDCYDCYQESKLELGVLGTAETQQDKQGRVWLKCTKVPHGRECLKLTHFIPTKCLQSLLSDLHLQCKRWTIYHQCQLLQNVDNDQFPTLNCLIDRKNCGLAFQSVCSSKVPSPICDVTSTSSPSPPVAPRCSRESSSTDTMTPTTINEAASRVSDNESSREDVIKGCLLETNGKISSYGENKSENIVIDPKSEEMDFQLNVEYRDQSKNEHQNMKSMESKITNGAIKTENDSRSPEKLNEVLNKGTEFEFEANLKRRRSLNSFIDKLVESSMNNPIVDAKISREDYLKLLKLSTVMETKVPRNWELGLKEPGSKLKACEQPSTTQKVQSDYVIALRDKCRNVGGNGNNSSLMQFEASQIGHIENAQFSVEWRLNRPVIVRSCGADKSQLQNFFTPEFFSKSFGSWKVDLVDCRTGRVHPMMSMEKFLQGFVDYSARRQHFGQLSNGCEVQTVLKLKDWPPGNDFAEIMPKESHQLLMEIIPLPDYTMRAGGYQSSSNGSTGGGVGGALNLASSLPSLCCAPDMGPKMFIAYGSPNEPSLGSTNLHVDMSDACNILLYACSANRDCDQTTCTEENTLLMKEVAAYGGEEALSRMKNGEKVGAIWNIFNTDDNDRLRKFLRNEAELQHKAYRCDDDPIHDQDIFLGPERLGRLKREEGVEPYTLVQFQHDAVFIPAGAPHQVRNLNSCIKAAVDFVSPERVKYCLQTTDEFRNLSDRHANHEDKLQIKSVIYHAVKDCLSVLKNTPIT